MKLSVIIPAYNCEGSIIPTLDSVVAQNVPEMEIIAVNDGSTDKTEQILNAYSQSHPQLKVVSTSNGGPAHARNAGIQQSSGDYIAFVDSDDLLYDNMYQSMLSLAFKYDLDVAACGYVMENVSGKSVHIQEFSMESFVAETLEQFSAKLTSLLREHLMYAVWNKLYKRSFLLENNISFPSYLSGEDRLFNIATFSPIRRFGFLKGPYYRYILHGSDTLANRYVPSRRESAIEAHRALKDAYAKRNISDAKSLSAIDFQFVKSVIACFTQLCSKDCPLSGKQKRAFITETLQEPLLQQAILNSDSELSYSKMVNRVLKTRNSTLILWMASAIFFLQYRLNPLYLRWKHNVKSDA